MAFRDTPPGAYYMLAANRQWTVREAADELDVSTGTISNWRKRIERNDPPKWRGRPQVEPKDRKDVDFERRVWLALNDPREGLVRVIRRFARRRNWLPSVLVELRIALYQTTYTVFVDRHGNHAPVETNGDAIVRAALGKKKAAFFLQRFRKEISKLKKPEDERQEPFRFEDFQTTVPAKARHCRQWSK